jgi:hypothetical protein
MAVYPFPSSNLALSQVLRNYNAQNGTNVNNMNSLRGQPYFDPDGTPRNIPSLGSSFSLSSLFGRYSLNPAPFSVTITNTGNVVIPSLATSRPPPLGFVLTLIGGGGGGGGAGGDYNTNILGIPVFRAGGQGCGGGGGGYLLTNRIPYVSGNAITVNSIPGGGSGGGNGFGGNNTSDGSAGNAGGSASVTYAGQTFIANGGSGGNPGFRGQIDSGGANANQPVAGGSFSGSNLSSSSNGGANGVVRGGGQSGNSLPSGGDGGQGNPGSNGATGLIQITWFFV